MARREGTLKLSSNIEPRVAAPLDARSKVASLADLTASGTFPYPYTGMEVYVASEQKKYLLVGNDPTVSANWVEAGSGSGQIIQVEEIPTANEECEDKIYQYIGETNLSFTNGYFYKCVSDGESTPSYSWTEVQVQEGGGTPHWTGTQAEYAIAASGIEDGTIVNITDDYQEGVEVVDVVEEDNEGVPTSAAVYEALHPTGTYSNWTFLWTSSGHLDFYDEDTGEHEVLIGRIRDNRAEFLIATDSEDRTISLPAAFQPSLNGIIRGIAGYGVSFSQWSTIENSQYKTGYIYYNPFTNRINAHNFDGDFGYQYFSYPLD